MAEWYEDYYKFSDRYLFGGWLPGASPVGILNPAAAAGGIAYDVTNVGTQAAVEALKGAWDAIGGEQLLLLGAVGVGALFLLKD